MAWVTDSGLHTNVVVVPEYPVRLSPSQGASVGSYWLGRSLLSPVRLGTESRTRRLWSRRKSGKVQSDSGLAGMGAMTPATAPQPTAACGTSDPPFWYLCSNAVKVCHLKAFLCTYCYHFTVDSHSVESVTRGFAFRYTIKVLAAVTVAVDAQLGPVSAPI